MNVEFKRLNNFAKTPTRGSKYAAGYDLYAATNYNIKIQPHSCAKIDIGIAVAIPEGYYGGFFARSGLATKQGLRPANCVGVIDADYRGPVCAVLYNDSNEVQTVEAGSRIAQLVIMPFIPAEFQEVDELNDTERGEGGFGSTGVN